MEKNQTGNLEIEPSEEYAPKTVASELKPGFVIIIIYISEYELPGPSSWAALEN